MNKLHTHLVSDSTGETANTVMRASLVQFDDIYAIEHIWNMVRSKKQLKEVISGIKENPGFVLFTLVDEKLRKLLVNECQSLGIPCISVLTPVVESLEKYLGAEIHASPGRQHILNDAYFSRIEAVNFVMGHDDGNLIQDVGEADIIVLGVSRTSKTPTCIYLANRGVKAANVPIIPGRQLPSEIFEVENKLIVGLTSDPKNLVQIRKTRLNILKENKETNYVDFEEVTKEVLDARRVFVKNNWPMIDITRRSVEETAATIMKFYRDRDSKATDGR
jgi:[pyruvate, water dikinase]-phosphate phosphotransferase / [pyruvate, water dikinase] kinase